MVNRTPDNNSIGLNAEQKEFLAFIDDHTPNIEVANPDSRGTLTVQYKASGRGYLDEGRVSFEIESTNIVANAFSALTMDRTKQARRESSDVERVDWLEFYDLD